MSGLISTFKLSLDVADEIASKVIQIALRNKFKPISVCVMDPSGHAIVTKRMDGCPAMVYPKISQAKAYTCVSVKSSSRGYGDKHFGGSDPTGPALFGKALNQITISDGNLAAFQGGVLIRVKESGDIVGSVGVSGAAGDEDEYCAITAVKECSIGDALQVEPADHSCQTVSNL